MTNRDRKIVRQAISDIMADEWDDGTHTGDFYRGIEALVRLCGDDASNFDAMRDLRIARLRDVPANSVFSVQRKRADP